MKKSYYFFLIIIPILFSGCMQNEGSQGKDFTEKVNDVRDTIVNDAPLLQFFNKKPNPLPHAYQALPSGSTTPKGWLLEIMEQDLDEGLVGALDELYPGIKSDDLYHTARRGGMEDIPEMGDLVLTGEEWETSIMWWNSETAGNWWDGFVRHAFLANNEKAIQQSKAIVNNLIASQDEDGYIGIYKKNLRYQHEGSNGELWSQTTAYRMLLAYYEITNDKKILDAVERAMEVTMKNYNKDARNPFDLKNEFGGATHGLMMTDVCETLHRITGKEKYQTYATFLYEAFSTYDINRAFNDMRYPFLMKKDDLFSGHGVHTYEQLRSLLNAYYSTGYEELKSAYENALSKLETCIVPGGSGHANEWIAQLEADPTTTATEYCSMLELRNFFSSAFLKTGDISYADQAEKLTFNDMMGSRNENGSAICYGKPNNCYKLDGKDIGKEEANPRYKYSPSHSEPAVCCSPNYGRNLPYYLDQMWAKKEDGLVAVLYGPSILQSSINDKEVSIEQITNYPFSDAIEFKISIAEPLEFALYFRKPMWTKSMQIEHSDGVSILENGFYKIEKEWKTGDVVQIRFENEIQKNSFKEEVYFQRGALVYALEIPHQEKNIKDYELDGFHDYYCFPKETSFEQTAFSGTETLEWVSYEISANDNPWYSGNVFLKGNALNTKSKSQEPIKLVPMGSTVLRRVTFPVSKL